MISPVQKTEAKERKRVSSYKERMTFNLVTISVTG